MLQIAFLHATRLHLRRQDVYDELRRLVPEQADALFRFRNVPNAILLHLGDRLRDAFHHGLLGESRLVAMEETMGELTRCLGGCERIKNTPMLRQYDDVPRIGVYLLSFMLPFGLNHALGWLTAPVAVLVAFLFLALDELGRAVEDPFENSINDVPLTALCASVEIDLRQMVGDANLPEPVTAVDGLLY
jgi:putative membrane protein